MSGRLLKLLYGIFLFLGIAVTAVWIAGETGAMHSPQHVAGEWAFRTGQTWPWSVCLLIFQDNPIPKIGPPFALDMKYTPLISNWYNQTIPVDRYSGSMGFAWNIELHLEINAGRSWVLLGRQIELRMPFWMALLLWLPILHPVIWWLKRRRWARTGCCESCGYDLRVTPARCPECGRAAAILSK